MKLIVCIDDKGGMMFNNRRLSSDRVVTEKIAQLSAGEGLLVSDYSYPLFSQGHIISAKDPLAGNTTHWRFIENADVSHILEQAEEIVIFHWNRTYPADLYFPVDAVRRKWHLKHSEQFSGNSHQLITMEVYTR